MSIEAMKRALDALEMLARYENPETKIQVRKPKDGGPIVTMYPHKVATDAANVLRTAIAEAEKQEPVAWLGLEPSDMPDGDDPMYDHDFFLKGMAWADAILRKKNTTPPAAQRQPLTEEEVLRLWAADVSRPVLGKNKVLAFARAIEAAHGRGEKT